LIPPAGLVIPEKACLISGKACPWGIFGCRLAVAILLYQAAIYSNKKLD